MPNIDGCKYSCEPCIRGHRATSCTHSDRLLIAVRKPGRPVTVCEHNVQTCQCGRLDQALVMRGGQLQPVLRTKPLRLEPKPEAALHPSQSPRKTPPMAHTRVQGKSRVGKASKEKHPAPSSSALITKTQRHPLNSNQAGQPNHHVIQPTARIRIQDYDIPSQTLSSESSTNPSLPPISHLISHPSPPLQPVPSTQRDRIADQQGQTPNLSLGMQVSSIPLHPAGDKQPCSSRVEDVLPAPSSRYLCFDREGSSLVNGSWATSQHYRQEETG